VSDEPGFPDELEEIRPGQQATADLGNPRAVRRRANALEIERREAETFWRNVFATPVGRREMWAILEQGHAFEERFSCGPNGFPQPEATWAEAGRQAFALRLYHSWCKVARDGVLTMHDEHDQRFKPPPKGRR
jgi:hypothetical protein